MKEYAKDFYRSSAWKKTRNIVIHRANGLCERCMAAGQYVPGVIVHHKTYITPNNIHDTSVTLNLDNLEYLCDDCHNKEHKSKQNGRYRFDSNGNLLPPMK
ncbi:MAG: HNH endonuclease [Lachnospiraceae bacterium]|nr:HNH endonuclease [Lachnospiraceae bacterium]